MYKEGGGGEVDTAHRGFFPFFIFFMYLHVHPARKLVVSNMSLQYLKTRLHRRFLSRNLMQFLSRFKIARVNQLAAISVRF